MKKRIRTLWCLLFHRRRRWYPVRVYAGIGQTGIAAAVKSRLLRCAKCDTYWNTASPS